MDPKSKFTLIATLCVFAFVALIASAFVAIPYYNVWQQEMAGRAEFAKYENNRKIKIEEDSENLEAEKLNAKAEK